MQPIEIVEKPKFNWKPLLTIAGTVFITAAVAIGITYFAMAQQATSDKNITDKKISELNAQVARSLQAPGSSGAKNWCAQQASDNSVETIDLVYTESSSSENMGYSFISCDVQWPSTKGAFFDGIKLIGRKHPKDNWSLIYKGQGFPSKELISQYNIPIEISGGIQTNL